ncbi:MAG: sterol desaturase family protein [Arenimonas sp.]
MTSTGYQAIGAWSQLSVFVGLLVLISVLEHFYARRQQANTVKRRFTNIGLILASTLSAQLIFPMATVVLTLWADTHGFGLFHLIDWPAGLEILLCLIVFDFAIYWQHRFFHLFPWLWRMHRVHHSDLLFDACLGIRFHPFEIVLSKAYKLAWIAALGPSIIAVIVYESLLLGFSLMTHGNIRLPSKLDAMLRTVFITPDFHRVHHSLHRDETDSNYGNILSVWDRIFGSYRAQPRDGHIAMVIGLPDFRSAAEQNLGTLLLQPFQNVKPIPDKEHA